MPAEATPRREGGLLIVPYAMLRITVNGKQWSRKTLPDQQ